MVATVTNPNMLTTTKTPGRLCVAAGYINRGISGSHGPSTNTTKINQGVIEPSLPVS